MVEDETFIAVDLKEALSELGADVVGPDPDLPQAPGCIFARSIDFAVLDIALREGSSLSLADTLADRQLPFLFATGLGAESIPQRHQGVAAIATAVQACRACSLRRAHGAD